MGQYIFITTEGTTFQPNNIILGPDIENLQVIGFADGDTVQGAVIRLVELNKYLSDTNFDEIFAIRLADDHREYFSLRDIFKKTGDV